MVLLTALIVLAFVGYRQNTIIDKQQIQLNAQSHLSEDTHRPRGAALDIQAKCAERARKAFAEMGYKPNDIADYVDHFDLKLNKCFMEVQSTLPQGTTIWQYREVFDAFEGKQYGNYAWHSEPDKKYWEVSPVACQVTLPTGEKQTCHSDGEFTKLIRVYMEE